MRTRYSNEEIEKIKKNIALNHSLDDSISEIEQFTNLTTLKDLTKKNKNSSSVQKKDIKKR